MKRPTSTLTQLRKDLGFTEHELAMRAGWSVNHQLKLEAHLEDIEQSDADVLGAILGVDIDQVIDGAQVSPPLATLLKGEANSLDAQTRFNIAEAVSVALLIQKLKQKLGLHRSWSNWRLSSERRLWAPRKWCTGAARAPCSTKARSEHLFGETALDPR